MSTSQTSQHALHLIQPSESERELLDQDLAGAIETEEVSEPTGDNDPADDELYEGQEGRGYAVALVEEEEKHHTSGEQWMILRTNDGGRNSSTLKRSITENEASGGRKKRVKVEGNLVGARPFQLRWLMEFEWLRYDPEKKRMHCTWCSAANKKNAFGKPDGTNNFRKSNCDEHTKSKDHTDAASQHRSGLISTSHLPQSELEPSGTTASSSRPYDGSSNYQSSSSQIPINFVSGQNQNHDVRFHARKAVMLLSGLLLNKNLPPSLARDFLEIMPFMFPDSRIAAELPNM